MSELISPQVGKLARRAATSLDVTPQTATEQRLREHQEDVLKSIKDHFASGESTGYISLPTGSGKSHIALEVAQRLDMRTVILSPTITILRQTGRVAREHTGLDIRDYFSDLRQDITSGVINTSYQSAPGLLQRGQLKGEDIELLICDELHTALGEVRHTLFRQFPRALMLGFSATPFSRQLEGYAQRGMIDQDERWVGLFTKQIHEMSLEEGILRGILTPLDTHLFQTQTKVEEINFSGSGELRDYSRSQLERSLNTAARNALAIGMVAGPDKIGQSVELSREQLDEVDRIHQQIKGKRTAIFGLSIHQIEELGTELRKRRVSAEEIHHGVPLKQREEILDLHSSNDFQVVLGVDALRLGWDSPATEVGIYMAPTHSGIVAIQELGRILRPSPETGKERAVAIQLLDQFARRSQAPIIIPNLFDPYYVLRGTRTGRETRQRKPTSNTTEPGNVMTFQGLHIDTLIQEAQSTDLLQRRLKQADLKELAGIIDTLTGQIIAEQPGVSPLDFYQRLAEYLPHFIPQRQQELALQGLASIDSNTVALAKKAFIGINIQAILSGVKRFFSTDALENEEMVQAAVVSVLEKVSDTASGRTIKSNIYRIAARAAAEVRSQKEHMHVEALMNGVHAQIKEVVDDLMEGLREPLRKGLVAQHQEQLAQRLGVPERYIAPYLQYRNDFLGAEQVVMREEDLFEELEANEQRRQAGRMMELGLTPIQKTVIELRFGWERGVEYTLADIAKEVGLTSERVRQIEAESIRKLKDPTLRRQVAREQQKPTDRVYTFMDRVYKFPYQYEHRSVDTLPNLSAAAREILVKNGFWSLGRLQYLTGSELKKITANRADIAMQIKATLDSIEKHGLT